MNHTEIFENCKNIAVVGMSRFLDKAAHTVPAYMKKQGFDIFPVNPDAETILKLKCYSRLGDVPDPIDMVNVFRPSEQALEVVKEAVERKRARGDIKVIWLQLGIINDEAKALAEAEGIFFIQDKCIYVEHRAFLSSGS